MVASSQHIVSCTAALIFLLSPLSLVLQLLFVHGVRILKHNPKRVLASILALSHCSSLKLFCSMHRAINLSLRQAIPLVGFTMSSPSAAINLQPFGKGVTSNSSKTCLVRIFACEDYALYRSTTFHRSSVDELVCSLLLQGFWVMNCALGLG